ncbi:MAG: IS630 family transposase [Bacteroidota bacterium]
MFDKLDRTIINALRRYYISGELTPVEIQETLNISDTVFYKYFKIFREIEQQRPKRLKDVNFFLPPVEREKDNYPEKLNQVLPGIIENTNHRTLKIENIWQEYRALVPDGCTLISFKEYFGRWRKEHNICWFYPQHIKHIPEEDLLELGHWQNSRDLKLWRKAVVIKASLKKRPVKEIATQLEVCHRTVLGWIRLYKERGIEGLREGKYKHMLKRIDRNKLKRENILKLLQQTPKLHGINRTAWTLRHLAMAYEKVYGKTISASNVNICLSRLGYHFLKSRERLVSPDKNFREKMDKIKTILANLQPDEKFFSIDEYGPATVKMKTGWSFTAETEARKIPEKQKIKGWYIIIAALELSENQVTHFYSRKKDSAETTRLIGMLREKYKDDRKLYLSWDEVSWHRSKQLAAYLTQINEQGPPFIELTPLPSSAQHLNVIESVFSGMAKTVIHNSDYDSLEACYAAIDRHFGERNAYYRLHPMKAGKKIWGKEIVPPVFKETNNCKSGLKKKISKTEKKYGPVGEDKD